MSGKSTSSSIGRSPRALRHAFVFLVHLLARGARGELDPDPPEKFDAYLDRLLRLAFGHLEKHLHARGRRRFDDVLRATRQNRERPLGLVAIPAQVLALGPPDLECKDEVVPALPAIVLEQRRPGRVVLRAGHVSAGCLGAIAGKEVQLCETIAFLSRSDERGRRGRAD